MTDSIKPSPKTKFNFQLTKAFTIALAFLLGVGLGSVLTYRYLSPYVGSNVDQQLIFKRKATSPAPAPAATPPASTQASPLAGSTSGWSVVTDSKYKLQMMLPPAWSKTVKDTDSGFSLTMDPGSGASGTVTIMSDDFGHGTPGPQVSQTSATVAGQSATKTIWEGGGNRLVQYKFTKDSLYYKFEMTASTGASQIFSDFDTAVASFKFTG